MTAVKGTIIPMRNREERITRMHARAAEIERKANRRRSGILGAASGALMVCLLIVVQHLRHMHHGILSEQNTGSSLLADSVGGYVLIAVIAFVLGTTITALIINYRKKRRGTGDDTEEK